SIPIEIVESKSVDISKIQYTTDGLIPPSTIVILTLKNTGTSNVTIGNIKVNGVSTSFAVNVSSTLEPKGEDIFTLSGLTADLTDGSKYRIDVFDVDGQLIG
ncbi:hypothetical protein MUO66_07555, partial [Candidatus Bathyarchaeota archaeon]|nr:hypothetical protein [Candidatus Bathyarchaeota archaeon]